MYDSRLFSEMDDSVSPTTVSLYEEGAYMVLVVLLLLAWSLPSGRKGPKGRTETGDLRRRLLMLEISCYCNLVQMNGKSTSSEPFDEIMQNLKIIIIINNENK